MQQSLLTLLILFVSSYSYGQIDYERGYFITNDGKRVECLIRNIDWKNSPSEFKYKLTIDSEVSTAYVTDVQEFVINSSIKYIAADVNIDRSHDYLNQLSKSRNPEFNLERLFLKVIIESNASLFYYNDDEVVRYFYQLMGESIQQLVYKQYFKSENIVAENHYFRQQLFLNLKCNETDLDVTHLNYSLPDLTKFFKVYNECIGANIIQYKDSKKRNNYLFISIRPGVDYIDFKVPKYPLYPMPLEFSSKYSFRIGIEFEYLLNFNNRKWSVFMEPTYQSYSASDRLKIYKTDFIQPRLFEVDYSSIEVPMGIRHYFYINKKNHRIFIDGAVLVDFPLHLSIKMEGKEIIDRSSKTFGVVAGLGYSIGDFNIQYRYYFKRSVLSKYLSWSSEYSKNSLILGYRISL